MNLGEISLWICPFCSRENNEDTRVCTNCGTDREEQDHGLYGGADESNFGGDPLWDDDQGLM